MTTTVLFPRRRLAPGTRRDVLRRATPCPQGEGTISPATATPAPIPPPTVLRTGFLGAARAWNRIRNVAGDTCALVRREAFQSVGGYPEEYRTWLQDMCFNNRLIQAGCQHRAHARPPLLLPHAHIETLSLPTLPPRPHEHAPSHPSSRHNTGEERAFCAFAVARIHAPRRPSCDTAASALKQSLRVAWQHYMRRWMS